MGVPRQGDADREVVRNHRMRVETSVGLHRWQAYCASVETSSAMYQGLPTSLDSAHRRDVMYLRSTAQRLEPARRRWRGS